MDRTDVELLYMKHKPGNIDFEWEIDERSGANGEILKSKLKNPVHNTGSCYTYEPWTVTNLTHY